MAFELTRKLASAGVTRGVSEAPNEAALLAACQEGDEQAFRSLFDSHKDRVYSLALYLTRDEAAASDMTQQAFLTLLAKGREFRGDAKLSTWLYRLVVNLCSDERRRQRRSMPLAAAGGKEAMSEKSPQENRFARGEIALAVKRAIESLKPKLRALVVLKYLDDLSYQEISQVLGCSIGTVASRLNRGHKLLARKLAYLRASLEGDE